MKQMNRQREYGNERSKTELDKVEARFCKKISIILFKQERRDI